MSYLDSYDKKKFLEELHDYKDSLVKHPIEASSIISALIENSTRIEGSTLTQKEVEDLLEYGIEPNKPDHEKSMVRDYSDGLLFVMKLYQNKIPLSIQSLEPLNRNVMKRNGEVKPVGVDRVVDTSLGKIRNVDVSWGWHRFMPHAQVKENLELVLSFINADIKNEKDMIDIYRLSFQIHYDVITIHPFPDGNSRTSRLLMNYIQGWYQQPLTTVLFEYKHQYKNALHYSWDENNPEFFINYMFNHTIDFFRFIKKTHHIGKGIKKKILYG
ncbi:MAG: Fic family protein [Flavobacteriaceae bacterium]|nr:Fic family protein [Flavobacteriaceae bacterium]